MLSRFVQVESDQGDFVCRIDSLASWLRPPGPLKVEPYPPRWPSFFPNYPINKEPKSTTEKEETDE